MISVQSLFTVILLLSIQNIISCQTPDYYYGFHATVDSTANTVLVTIYHGSLSLTGWYSGARRSNTHRNDLNINHEIQTLSGLINGIPNSLNSYFLFYREPQTQISSSPFATAQQTEPSILDNSIVESHAAQTEALPSLSTRNQLRTLYVDRNIATNLAMWGEIIDSNYGASPLSGLEYLALACEIQERLRSAADFNSTSNSQKPKRAEHFHPYCRQQLYGHRRYPSRNRGSDFSSLSSLSKSTTESTNSRSASER